MSKALAEDALSVDMPTNAADGKSIIVVGAGISGLAVAKYLLQAGGTVTHIEAEDKVGGNNNPYVEGGRHDATTCIFTRPCMQPHYLDLCHELGLSQTQSRHANGVIRVGSREITAEAGTVWVFLKSCFEQ